MRRMRVTLRCFDSMGQGRMGQPWGREEWVNRLLSGSDPYYGLSRGFVALFCNSAVTVLSLLTCVPPWTKPHKPLQRLVRVRREDVF